MFPSERWTTIINYAIGMLVFIPTDKQICHSGPSAAGAAIKPGDC